VLVIDLLDTVEAVADRDRRIPPVEQLAQPRSSRNSGRALIGAFSGKLRFSKLSMPRTSTISCQYGSRYGTSASMLGTFGWTSQSMAPDAFMRFSIFNP
jgi:hypothetical protein